MKKYIRERLLGAGAIAAGFAKAGEISAEASSEYEKWIGEGCHGEMGYLERHAALRRHTDHVLPRAQTVISVAFSYVPEEYRPETDATVASYAYGEDYHKVLREKLKPTVDDFKQRYGGSWRICIDSAPVAERYWAIKAGIGKRGLNGAVIVEGCGPMSFLVEILTTLEISSDVPSEEWCERCGKCLIVCPGQALKGDGSMDARKCINYLTIEKKGEFSEEEKMILRSGHGHLFGCDRCLRVCDSGIKKPGRNEIKTLESFLLQKDIRELTPEKLVKIGRDEFEKKYCNSALGYSGYDKLIRNAKNLRD